MYYTLKGESEENLEMMRKMDQEHLEHPSKGVVSMMDFLLDEGYRVGQRRVRRLMRLMGIQAIYPKEHLSVPGPSVHIMPYLLRGLKIDHRNQVWSIDITYIPMAKGVNVPDGHHRRLQSFYRGLESA